MAIAPTQSQRNDRFGDSTWAMPISGLANYLVPTYHQMRDSFGVFVPYDQQWTTSYYLGIGPIAFAIFALGGEKKSDSFFLMILCSFGLLMAMGDNQFVYEWVRQVVPQLGFMRFPIKFVILATFVLPLLAANGLAWLLTLPRSKDPTLVRSVMRPICNRRLKPLFTSRTLFETYFAGICIFAVRQHR